MFVTHLLISNSGKILSSIGEWVMLPTLWGSILQGNLIFMSYVTYLSSLFNYVGIYKLHLIFMLYCYPSIIELVICCLYEHQYIHAHILIMLVYVWTCWSVSCIFTYHDIFFSFDYFWKLDCWYFHFATRIHRLCIRGKKLFLCGQICAHDYINLIYIMFNLWR